ncbi:Short-chain dehydrogenase/reductase SDR [Macrophomina phaseolina MS6]|uniref:Short-chain dehydrogenase/reductase SDR n=1 Tax=Macrophomina phaseolina (strain MS6) TaxID=1126212 RepID=K2S7U6_MACPH|nr:Short-chain dehydrogenase/reductase SDR [Macrophomina phaseolina MS6]
MPSTESLLSLEPFAAGNPTGFASPADIKNAYDRARLIGRHYALSLQDIVSLSPRFWAFHLDLIHAESGNALVILTTHLNLCIGTLGDYLPERPDLQPLAEKLLNFDLVGQFLLTEVGWGVDADELKSTATLQPDGTFELHTPHEQAAKFMSWTTPDAAMPSGGIVFARLIVQNEDRGIRPFWVMLHDGQAMEPGVVSHALPKRAGAPAVDHAVTTFTHKHLPFTALLGTLTKPSNPATHFASIIHRASIGTLSISTVNVPCLKLSTYTAARYSSRRHVSSPSGTPIPILAYRTQQRPLLHALAHAFVWEAAAQHAASLFTAAKADPALQAATAIPFKCAIQRSTQRILSSLADCCGAQGLYEHNAIISCQSLMRGNSLAEGDVVVIAIRLVSELLLSGQQLPSSRYPDAPVVRASDAKL